MVTADKFGFPQGSPLFDVSFRAISEALAGNGILASGDFSITEGTADMDLDVSPGTAWHNATEYVEGTTSTVPVPASDPTNDRWDTVVYDTTVPEVALRQGTADPTPEPPDLQSGDLLLGYVSVPAGATDVPASNIYEWRATASQAADMFVADAGNLYDSTTVEDALGSELQFGAQLLGYPIPNSDILNSSLSVNAGTGLSTTNAPIGLGGSATLSIPSGGVSASEIADGTVTSTEIADGTIATADLAADAVTTGKVADGTLTDADISSSTTIARSKLDDKRITGSISTDTTTADEEVLFVDSSGGPVTVTLASSDAVDGNLIQILDIAGTASTNAITVATEGTETIDGVDTYAVEDDYGGIAVLSNGTNWTTAGGGTGSGSGAGLTAESIATDASGSVAAAESGVVHITSVPGGGTLNVRQASLLNADGTAAATGCDLVIATLDGTGAAALQTTVITGDGTTAFDDETGDPLASYTNASGSAQRVALLIDNGNFNAGTGGPVEVFAGAIGEVST